jgi:hypothetical protein
MFSEMDPLIRSRFNAKRRFMTDVGIFALSVAFHFPLQLPFGAIAAG